MLINLEDLCNLDKLEKIKYNGEDFNYSNCFINPPELKEIGLSSLEISDKTPFIKRLSCESCDFVDIMNTLLTTEPDSPFKYDIKNIVPRKELIHDICCPECGGKIESVVGKFLFNGKLNLVGFIKQRDMIYATSSDWDPKIPLPKNVKPPKK